MTPVNAPFEWSKGGEFAYLYLQTFGVRRPDPSRFPSGFKALGDYMHAKNVSFGIYSDMGTNTCGGYPGSEGFEDIDAKVPLPKFGFASHAFFL